MYDPNLSFGIGEENASKRAASTNGRAGLLRRFSDYVSFARTRVKTRRGMVRRITANGLRTYFNLDAIGYSVARAPMKGLGLSCHPWSKSHRKFSTRMRSLPSEPCVNRRDCPSGDSERPSKCLETGMTVFILPVSKLRNSMEDLPSGFGSGMK